MCDVWKRYRKDRRLPLKEMDVEELVGYIQESHYLQKIQRVVVSGGEPFLKKDLVDLVYYFAKAHSGVSDIGILSNLYQEGLTVRRLEEIQSRCGRVQLWIGTSLDGVGERHDQTRGKGDAYRKFRTTLTSIKQRFPLIPVSVNFTLTPENADDLYAVFRFCQTEGLGFSCQFPVPWKDAETFSFSEKTLDAVDEMILKIVEEKVQRVSDLRVIIPEIFYLTGLVEYQRHPQRVFACCGAGAQFVTISPIGDVYLCPPLKGRVVGSLRQDPFDTIWVSKRAQRLRKWIAQGTCHCWLNCTVYPNVRMSLEDTQVETRARLPWWKRWKRYA
jgi:radical SAM protein with 4Fe4S-binding SPASM domain